MTIDMPQASHIPALRNLWQQVFGDDDSFLDRFFTLAYAPQRALCVIEDDRPVAMLYWLDASYRGQQLAYLYAIATDPAYRGQGLCRKLMEKAHAQLQKAGYAGAVLVPAEDSLFTFYGTMGYLPFGATTTFTCAAGAEKTALIPLTATEYAAKRAQLLPPGSILQEGPTLQFLDSICDFYAGEDFLLCGSVLDGVFHAQELLGNHNRAPEILTAMGVATGCFRSPGGTTPAAMELPLKPDFIMPDYLGLPLD